MVIFVGALHCDLQEVLIGLEEGELLEETLPGDHRVALVLDELICDHGSLLELHQHDCLGRHGDVVGGVHRREGRGDDRHKLVRVRLVDELLGHFKADLAWIVSDVTESDWVLCIPVIVPIKLEKSIQKLVRCHIRIVFADLGH